MIPGTDTRRQEKRRTRRDFLGVVGGCAAYLAAGLSALATTTARGFASQARGQVVAESEFARIEQLREGIWAVVSTPLKNGVRQFQTTSNGGILRGTQGVMLIEGYMSDAGAAWVSEHAARLTGERPTHVVVTHFHADHCRGLPGHEVPADVVHATPTTRERMGAGPEPLLPGRTVSEGDGALIDLGGVAVRLQPRMGHTPSDVTIEIEDPAVVFCGDLVWNAMFPNFVDAIPSHQVRHCEAILGRQGVTYVPGHGDVGDAAALAPYLGLLQDLETAGRHAAEQGIDPAAAAAAYSVPSSLGAFVQFGDDYVERAFRAWSVELTQGD